MKIIDRIKEIIKYKGISTRKFCLEVGVANGFFDKVRDVGTEKALKILNRYPDISPEWLLTGKGDMLREPSVPKPTTAHVSTPMVTTAATDTPEQAHVVSTLKAIISEQMGIIASLNRQIGGLENDVKNMSRQISYLSSENEAAKKEMEALKKEMELKKEDEDLRNAMAELKGNDMHEYDVHTQPHTAILAAAEPHVDYHRQRPGTK